MENIIRNEIMEKFGKNIILDRKRFMSVVDDLCPHEKRMRELLSVCLETFPAGDLLEEAEQIDQANPDRQLSKYVQGLSDAREDIGEIDAKRVISVLFYGLTGICAFPDIRTDSEVPGWMKMAADKGAAEAAYRMGLSYDLGSGGTPDAQKAFAYYEIAARQNHVEASYRLGGCYARGRGVEKNIAKAMDILSTVEDHGYWDALLFMARCYSKGEGAEQNPNKAFALYEKAANLGSALAMNHLGVCYTYGNSVEKDPDKAAFWFERAENAENA